MMTARYWHTATLLANGKVLVSGGYGGDADTELYDPSTGTWTVTRPLSTPRQLHSATALLDGSVLVAGGNNNGATAFSSVELFDPATGMWTVTNSLNTARAAHTATLLPSGKVLVVGGSGNGGFFSSGELYDTDTGSWAATRPMGTARAYHTATLLADGKVLITGGIGGGGAISSVEVYDPDTDTWSMVGRLAEARYLHTATLLGDGRVLVAGGYGNTYLSSAEVYDPTTGVWLVTGGMSKGRQWHTATLRGNGRVMVTGGQGPLGESLSTTEEYDPIAGTWTTTDSLNDARWGQTATLLVDGRVLVAGGCSAGSLRSAELYSSGSVLQPVGSAQLSEVVVSPGTAPADGQSPVMATVTLRDGNGNPVSGKTVGVSAVEQLISGGVAKLSSVTQPAGATDVYGRATATVRSAMAGTAMISAEDVTDGVVVGRKPTVMFTSALVPPNSDLTEAVVMLYRITGDYLNDSSLSISSIVTDAGKRGDDFHAYFGEDKAIGALDAVYGITTALVGTADDVRDAKLAELNGAEKLGDIPEWGLGAYLFNPQLMQSANLPSVMQSVVLDVLQDAGVDLQGYTLDELVKAGLRKLGSQPTGLTVMAASNARNCLAYQQTLAQQGQLLLTQGIPPLSAGQRSAWASDLESRYGYSGAMVAILAHEDGFLQQFEIARQYSSQDALEWAASKFAAEVGVSALFKPAGIIVSLGTTILDEHGTMQKMDSDQGGYDIAYGVVVGGAQYAKQACQNGANAYREIGQGQKADPVLADIGPMTDVEVGYQVWSPWTLSSYLSVTKAYSLVFVTNTGPEDARFEVVVLSGYAGSAYGVGIPDLPQTTMGVLTIPANGCAQVPITYFDGSTGGRPDPATTMSVYVLGVNNSGTFYIGQFRHDWSPSGSSSGAMRPMAAQQEIENPVTSYVSQNSSNQTYEAKIFVVNPFDQEYSAIVTQALPAGFSVLDTDGSVVGSAIVWTNVIPGGGLAKDYFTFAAPLAPAIQTNLPAATAIFVDQENNSGSVISSVASGFQGLLPVLVTGSVPNGVAGSDVPMVLTVTNWTGTSQGGTIAISATNADGALVWSSAMRFVVDGIGNTNLTFMLPGDLPVGSYSVVGCLSIGGGLSKVLSGTYFVPAAPVTLGFGSAAGVLTNGFALELQGTPGYGYLIQTSTNLVDWQPVQYLVLTNSSGFYSDYYAPHYGQRFYRALTVPQGQ